MNKISELKGMKILIVEDHAGLAELLADEIRDAGLEAQWVTSTEKALPLLAKWEPDLIVSDLRLPGADGMMLLQHSKSKAVPPEFLIITAFGTVSQAVEAIKMGADDFLTKPLDLEQFMLRMARLLETRRLRAEIADYRRIFEGDSFYGMYGRSKAMRELFSQIKQIAAAQGPVLIEGESGTGKELVANAIHKLSERNEKAFLAINCAGVPETLMESEFFGHAAGAFTGARHKREGFFLEAAGGTLLLDEIAEMPVALQSKLLRILQDGKVRPVGSNKEQQVDVRIIAATHQDLEKAVQENRFRQDLYYRLETFVIRVPPIRERDDDIELLAQRFLALYNKRMQKNIQEFEEPALDMLRRYSFPGNVRELHNAVERAVAFCNEKKIRVKHLPAKIRQTTPATGGLPQSGEITSLLNTNNLPPLADVDMLYIKHVIQHTGNNKKKAADILGISRKTLYQRLKP